jgi:predicted NAD/FAD-binding protein
MPFSGIPPPVSGPGVSSRSAATLESRPSWLIVEDGIRQYIEAMAPEDRRVLEAITRRTELRRSGKLTHPCSPKVTQAF